MVWAKIYLVAQVADIVYARIGGGVNFYQIQQAFLIDGAANLTIVAGTFRHIGVETIDRFGEDARGGCFAGAACAGEQIRVRDAIQHHRVFERVYDVVLPLHVVKRLRAIFEIKRLSRHRF